MRILTTARHFELDPEDRLFAEERLQKIDRFARDLRETHLVVTAERYRHVAEITARLKHRDIVSREESTQPRRAIELAADRLEQQLRRIHERRVDRKRASRSPNGKAEPPAPAAEGEDFEEFEDS